MPRAKATVKAAPRRSTSYKFAADVRAALEAGKARHNGNRTAYLEALVRADSGQALIMTPVKERPGLWLPATPADLRVLYQIQQPADGEISPVYGNPADLVARAAGLGITVVFRPGDGG
jgi:hypothetical protein